MGDSNSATIRKQRGNKFALDVFDKSFVKHMVEELVLQHLIVLTIKTLKVL